MTEREYRALPRDSYSTIKDLIDSRQKYYRKHVLNERTSDEEAPSDDILRGSLVDCLIFSPEEKDARFCLADFVKPSGQLLDFVEALWRRTKEHTDDAGRQTRDFASLAEEAFNDVAYDANGNRVAFKQKGMDLAKVLERFQAEGLAYYEHLRNSGGRIVLELQDEMAAENIVRELKTNFATRDIFRAHEVEHLEVHDQLVILWEYHGVPMKSMLDRVIVDHEAKKVFQYDLKVGWNVENLHYNYLKLRYYIQVACYSAAILSWVEEKGLQDYEVEPMRFIVADSTGRANPLVYQTNATHLAEAINGFRTNGKEYTGLRKAVDDLKWHRQTGLWNISRENYMSKGLVTLNYKEQ